MPFKESDSGSRGSGTAPNGLIEATASPGPTLSLTLNPRVKRLDVADLMRQVTDAFNAALHDLRTNSAPVDEPLADLAALTTQLREIQVQTVSTLSTLGEKINIAMAAAGQQARLDVDATVAPTANLLEQAGAALVLAQAGGLTDTDARGHGAALDDRIRVVATAGGIEAVEIDRRAIGMAVEDLAAGLAEAANAALKDLRTATQASAPVDRTELKERTREIRDQGVQNMRSYAQAISDLMARLDVTRSGE